jgi:hypothetical protein
MHELVQKYFDKALEEQKKQLLNDLRISRVYEGQDTVKGYEYPFYCPVYGKHYRLQDIKITNEEYFQLLELYKAKKRSTNPEGEPSVSEPSVSGWCTFGVILIILMCLAGVIIMFSGDFGLPIGIGIIISAFLTGAPMILLSNIEYQLKKLNNK